MATRAPAPPCTVARERHRLNRPNFVISADTVIGGVSPRMPGRCLIEWRDDRTSRDRAVPVAARWCGGVAALVTASMAGEADAGSAMVSVRRADQMAEDHPWDGAGVDLLAAAPWRTFRWYDGQQHFSGTYWSSTQRDHVIYESRLELAVLLLADFDPSVTGIFAQPFLLRAQVGGVARKHIPDYLLLTDAGPVVVDVKPRHRLARPEVAFTFGWTRALVEARGWRYDVRCEPPAARLENVRFLAGYRRDWLFDQGLLARLRAADLDGARLGEAFGCLPGRPEPLVRAAVLHLVWAGHFTVDLDRPLSGSHLLRAVR